MQQVEPSQYSACPLRSPLTNQFVLPEMIAHASLTVLFLISFQVVAFILNAPLLAYNVNKFVTISLLPFKLRH